MGSKEEEIQREEKWLVEKCGLSVVQDLTALTKLNLPDCCLSELPSNLASLVPNLSILFCPKNRFVELPPIIGECPNLQMVSFKENGMKSIHPEALQPQLRWLILTGNSIEAIPETIGRCTKLQKLMLSGNNLKCLPESVVQLNRLELVRLARNDLEKPPMKLLQLPNLRWVALSRNPFLKEFFEHASSEDGMKTLEDPSLEDTNWPVLGQGAGGVTRRVTWQDDRLVAVKTYAGALTSDGSPQDERAASVVAATLNESALIQLLGQTPNGSLVMEFLEGYEALAGPPSMATCSRDVYEEGQKLSEEFAWKIATDLLRVLTKIHLQKGICHGDFYGHNILINPATSSVKLSDFGGAFFYNTDSEYGKLIQQVELRAYCVLVEELGSIVREMNEIESQKWNEFIKECKKPGASFEKLSNSMQ